MNALISIIKLMRTNLLSIIYYFPKLNMQVF